MADPANTAATNATPTAREARCRAEDELCCGIGVNECPTLLPPLTTDISRASELRQAAGADGYTLVMGFYYGSSTPPPEEKGGSAKELVLMILAVFRVLAVPLAIIIGGMAGLVSLFFVFAWSAVAGFAVLGLIVLAVAGYAAWEWRHPPQLKG